MSEHSSRYGTANLESDPLLKHDIFNPPVINETSKRSKVWDFLYTIFPILHWLPKYNFSWLQHDIIAGLTVGLTVLPQGLAYAQIADLPPQYGLYTAFMGGFIYCILGTSKDITLGPTAIMSLFVHSFGDGDIVQVVALTLLGGCIQLAMGILRLGFVMRYLSVPVISGFTSAAAITIGFGQVKHILGVKVTHSEYFVPELIETFKKVPESNVWDVLVGCVCIVLLLLLKFCNRGITRSETDSKCRTVAKVSLWFVSTARNAIIVLSAAAVAFAIHSQNIESCKVPDCITLTGTIKKGLPPFKPPAFSETKGNSTIYAGELISNIGAGLIVVPLMGFLESIAIGKAFARKGGYSLDINQEMIAIGVANILSSFVSSYTITGSFSRTAINHQSHVKTPAGGIFTGLLVIVGLLVLTPLFYYIPKAALAAVIISAVVFMIDYATVYKLWCVKKIDLIPLFVTFIMCFWYIPYGILGGVGISLLILLYPVSFPGVNVSTVESTAGEDKENLLILIQSGLTFPCAEYISNRVKKETKLKEGTIRAVILDFQHIFSIDFTTAQSFGELAVDMQQLQIKLTVVSIEEEIRETLIKAIEPGSITFYRDSAEALAHI